MNNQTHLNNNKVTATATKVVKLSISAAGSESESDLRRFAIATDTGFADFGATVRAIAGFAPTDTLVFTYRDADGDTIRFDTDAEFGELVRSDAPLRVSVATRTSAKQIGEQAEYDHNDNNEAAETKAAAENHSAENAAKAENAEKANNAKVDNAKANKAIEAQRAVVQAAAQRFGVLKAEMAALKQAQQGPMGPVEQAKRRVLREEIVAARERMQAERKKMQELRRANNNGNSNENSNRPFKRFGPPMMRGRGPMRKWQRRWAQAGDNADNADDNAANKDNQNGDSRNDNDESVKSRFPLRVAKAAFRELGLDNVAFITPEQKERLKAQAPGTFRAHRLKLAESGAVILPPQFVRRVRQAKSDEHVRKMCACKAANVEKQRARQHAKQMRKHFQQPAPAATASIVLC